MTDGHRNRDGSPKNSYPTLEKAQDAAARRLAETGRPMKPYRCRRRPLHYHLTTIRPSYGPRSWRFHEANDDVLTERAAACLWQENDGTAEARLATLAKRSRATVRKRARYHASPTAVAYASPV